VGRLGVSQGTTKKCPFVEHRSPRRRNFRLKGSGNWKFTMPVPNSLLEIGGLVRDSTGAALCNQRFELHVRPPSNVMNSRRLTARCLPCSRPKGLGTADCCIHPFGRSEMIAITPPKIFSKEVAQKQATPFPRQDLLTARNRF